MNKDRRKRLEEITERLGILRDELETLMNEEQDAFDNLPENFQNSERGECAQTKIDTISDALDDLDIATNNLEEVLGD